MLDQLWQMDDRVSAKIKTLVLNDSRDRVYGHVAGGESSIGGQKPTVCDEGKSIPSHPASASFKKQVVCREDRSEGAYGSSPLANREIRSANHSSLGIWIIQPLMKYVGVALTPT